jgi:Domain of unknown function (DUF4437)
MGRPHLEPLVDRDIVPKALRLAGWQRGIQYRTLSIDPVNGACTQVIEVEAGFRQPAGFAHSEWELFVLEGSLTVGNQQLVKDHYLFVPAGYRLETLASENGCRAIWFWNDHHPDWVAADGHRDSAVRTRDFVSTATRDELRWAVPSAMVPQTEPGVFLKILRMEELTGAFTGLYVLCPGFWQDNISYHDCMEESYHIWGESWMLQFGSLPTGGYFYRPPYINHGPFQCEHGTYAIFRTDSWLVNHFHWNPFSTPEENRQRVLDKVRARQPLLTDWTYLTRHEFTP